MTSVKRLASQIIYTPGIISVKRISEINHAANLYKSPEKPYILHIGFLKNWKLLRNSMELDKMKDIMIQEQLIGRGIRNPAVINAMRKVKREKFIDKKLMNESYGDFPLPAGFGQTVSQPYIVALMTEELELFPEAKTLEIGTGTGYQTAILREICRNIFTMERIPDLSINAEKTLGNEGYDRIFFRVGSGYDGWAEEAPFDRIISTCAPEYIPEKLTDQLTDEGIMIIPVGKSFFQNLIKIKKTKGIIKTDDICCVRFVPMIE